MKKLLNIILISSLSIGFAHLSNAQGQGQAKKQEAQEKATEKRENRPAAPGKEDTEKAQDKKPDDKGKPEEKGKPEQAGKARDGEEKDIDSELERKESPGKAHAYGRHKGDMSGKEFGQMRSDEAKSRMREKITAAEAELNEEEKRVNENRKKVEEARERNENARKEKRIDEKQYEERKARIEEADKKVKAAEDKVKTEKARLKKTAEEAENEETEH